MGYMGFGMRKEAYRRVPREHMSYLKPWLTGKRKPVRDQEGNTEREGVEHLRAEEKSTSQPRAITWRKILAGMLALSLAAGLVWVIVRLMTAAMELPNRAPAF